ncbi:MAG: hypothetical protein P8009_03015 [Gammaproteobacteria bacterium]|nr:hypothetical protein [Gammaproteobacteria bacterium]
MTDATRTAYLHLQDDADQNTRQALIMKLEWERGIHRAVFDAGKSQRLRVDYDPAHFSELTLLDAVRGHGWQAELEND